MDNLPHSSALPSAPHLPWPAPKTPLYWFSSFPPVRQSSRTLCPSSEEGGQRRFFSPNSQENIVPNVSIVCVWMEQACVNCSYRLLVFKELLSVPHLRVLPLGSSGGSWPDSPPPLSRWSAAAQWLRSRCHPGCWHWRWPPPPDKRENEGLTFKSSLLGNANRWMTTPVQQEWTTLCVEMFHASPPALDRVQHGLLSTEIKNFFSHLYILAS